MKMLQKVVMDKLQKARQTQAKVNLLTNTKLLAPSLT